MVGDFGKWLKSIGLHSFLHGISWCEKKIGNGMVAPYFAAIDTKHSKNTLMIKAGVAQLVERQPSKLNVASSNLVSRSIYNVSCPRSSVGRALPW
jgi:hypothetical protein